MLCDERASIDWARVMRGIASIANAVTPADASRLAVSASVSGFRKPIRTLPRSMSSRSVADGARTTATTSEPQASAADPIVAPASANA